MSHPRIDIGLGDEQCWDGDRPRDPELIELDRYMSTAGRDGHPGDLSPCLARPWRDRPVEAHRARQRARARSWRAGAAAALVLLPAAFALALDATRPTPTAPPVVAVAPEADPAPDARDLRIESLEARVAALTAAAERQGVALAAAADRQRRDQATIERLTRDLAAPAARAEVVRPFALLTIERADDRDRSGFDRHR